MLIDHIGLLFFSIATPVGFLCRMIGRLTCPIMCYFLAEGFVHTSSRKKYALRLLTFALISQPAFSLLRQGDLLSTKLNMLFTLLISFLILWCYKSIPHKIWKWIPMLMLLFVARYCDYGTLAPFLVAAFYFLRHHRGKQMAAFACLAAVYSLCRILPQFEAYQLIYCGLFVTVPLLLLYNGKRGGEHPMHKWIFYVFYPLHMLALCLIAFCI